MTVFVIEIERRPILAFETSLASNLSTAEIFVDKAKWLHDDLLVLEFEGKPLWDGKSPLHIRKSLSAEQLEFETSRAVGRCEDEFDDDDWVSFLVPVTGTTDDEFSTRGSEQCRAVQLR